MYNDKNLTKISTGMLYLIKCNDQAYIPTELYVFQSKVLI